MKRGNKRQKRSFQKKWNLGINCKQKIPIVRSLLFTLESRKSKLSKNRHHLAKTNLRSVQKKKRNYIPPTEPFHVHSFHKLFVIYIYCCHCLFFIIYFLKIVMHLLLFISNTWKIIYVLINIGISTKFNCFCINDVKQKVANQIYVANEHKMPKLKIL